MDHTQPPSGYQRSHHSLLHEVEDIDRSFPAKRPSEDFTQARSPTVIPSLPQARSHLTTNTRDYPNMSAMTAMPYDSRMELGMSRSSYTWSGLDPNADFMNHNFCSMGPSSDAGLTTSSIESRSITASPPQSTLTAEQRELKRQRDMARRDSKSSLRARRAMADFRESQSPPLSLSEYNAATSMPLYAPTQPQLSLMAGPDTTIPGVSTYVTPYSTSPPISDQQSTMFPTPYEYMGMGYNSGYPSSSPTPPTHSQNHALSPQYRQPQLSDHASMMYPGQPLMHSTPVPSAEASVTVSDPGHVRVVQTRPKPQCWEHGCNGRQFSTFSNLLRHQREKSGQATKSSCPNCGAEFTRTTARNGHLLHDKCKQRKSSS